MKLHLSHWPGADPEPRAPLTQTEGRPTRCSTGLRLAVFGDLTNRTNPKSHTFDERQAVVELRLFAFNFIRSYYERVSVNIFRKGSDKPTESHAIRPRAMSELGCSAPGTRGNQGGKRATTL